MTDLLYHHDSYLHDFTATVAAVEDGAIALDRTAFYPGGGGQPHDVGMLIVDEQPFPVTKVGRSGATIWHYSAAPLAVGQTVRAVLDWGRRYRLMRTHTAMHILCGVIWRDYGASVTGGQMEPLRGRMDFEFETMKQEFVRQIEVKITAEVAAARSVRVAVWPRAEALQIPDLIRTKINLLPEGIAEVRTVEIVGLDLQADGGTHVANTREVGVLKIVDYKSKGKINKRLEVSIE